MATRLLSEDPDTDKLLRIVVWNLARFFGHSESSAEKLLREFYSRWKSPEWGDDFYHHEGAFRSAAFIHYSEINGGSTNFYGFHDWFRAQNFRDSEREAMQYFREHYFDKDRKMS